MIYPGGKSQKYHLLRPVYPVPRPVTCVTNTNIVQDTSSISVPQLPLAEDPIGILPGITQFLSQQFKTFLQPPEPKEAPEIIEDAGFRSEVHKVTTEDGYILTMHR